MRTKKSAAPAASKPKRKPLVRRAPKPPAALPENQKPGPDYVCGLEITARVRPEDADFIYALAREHELPVQIIGGVLADLGDSAMRDSAVAARVVENHISSTDSGRFVWRCIHRETEDYNAPLPVLIDCDGQEFGYETDAECIGRDIGDWIGSVIMVGVLVARSSDAVRYLSKSGLFPLFAAAAHNINKRGGIAA